MTAKLTESAPTDFVSPRFSVVLPLTTSCAPAGAGLRPSATRTSPVSCCAFPRTGMLRVKLSLAKIAAAKRRERAIPRATGARFMMDTLLCRLDVYVDVSPVWRGRLRWGSQWERRARGGQPAARREKPLLPCAARCPPRAPARWRITADEADARPPPPLTPG